MAASVLGVGAFSRLHAQPRAGGGAAFLHPEDDQGLQFGGFVADAKAACMRPDDASYADCEAVLQSIRDFAWPRVMKVLEGGKAGIELSPTPTAVKGYIRGGTRVTLPACKRPEASAEDPPPALYFRHIWKSGGRSIMGNMHSIGLPAAELTKRFGLTMWEEHSLCDELKASKQEARDWGQPDPVIFTFVRDPISRFISGYRELEYRHHFPSPHPEGSPERAAQFVQAVLGGLFNGHVLPQSQFILGQLGSVPGPLGSCPVPFNFIGKLEDFDEHWALLGERLHCPAGAFPFNHSLGAHGSSQDTPTLRVAEDGMRGELSLVAQHSDLHAEAMLSALRREGGTLMKAVCLFFLADFALFDYDLPEECGAMISVREALAREHIY